MSFLNTSDSQTAPLCEYTHRISVVRSPIKKHENKYDLYSNSTS